MYCSLCQRIINIRKRQGKKYFQDLCDECKEVYIMWNNIVIDINKYVVFKNASKKLVIL